MKKITYISLILLILQACSKDASNSSGPGSTGQGGSLARFAISEDHLYAVNGMSLKVFDISNTEKPIFKGEDDLGVNVETLFARDKQTLFVGTMQGMYIYNISTPPHVVEYGHYEHVVSCDPVVANDQYAFVTLHSNINNGACSRSINQLDVVDIRDLTNPRLLNSYDMTEPKGLGLHGDTLLVCDAGIKVMNVSDVQQISTISHQEDIEAVDIIPFNDLMIIATTTGFSQYRFENGNLILLSEI